ncbi:alpha-glucan family phosphorylase [Parenemella sanctibonifatiensis]|uniref:glycogen phosphorylase n=1 Tax=Parenemella sanctibonifatiensis TaxID=2016505 RepID=A0A255E4Q7_9ACTN|nr:alpha-glucan family phosphorylase [Parenemella sanctibonifatiensis]OYN86577.1 glycogen phosphorylase [Parenemella sanctibonifatiensis]
MRAIRRLTVHPVLPAALEPLKELALNLRWAWHRDTQLLFRAVDPELWDEMGPDPTRLLGRVSPSRLAELAEDTTFVRNVERAARDLEDYLSADLWYQRQARAEALHGIGYFSAEFGITEALPQYSGGLGILAGDHLKAASDLGVPIIGVGLLYREGYFRQSLNASGWQQERYPVLDPHDMPLRLLLEDGEPVQITVPLGDGELTAQIWIAQVGRVPLLMLDSNLAANTPEQRHVTDRLYGGDADHRLAQEVLLGVGGVRALRAYCRITGRPAPAVYHCNEGHAGFLGLERIREYMAEGLDWETAVEHTRAGNVFTTHTPVPAGIDRFGREKVADQFGGFGDLPVDRVLALGSEDYEGGDPGVFNMAVMGFRLGQRANGVSKLHGVVSREMFQGLWPAFDTSEVPIGSVTNGVHHRTWMHPELLELVEARTGDAASVTDGSDWSAIDRIDDNTLWSLKRQMRGELVTDARVRLARSCRQRGIGGEWVGNALSPHTLTLGFARRGASYKRLTLMLTDADRLARLLNDPDRPVQIVIAGKSHPADDIGKSLIQQMVQFADRPDVRGKIVFLPDYDISLARTLYPGCDVWMNNPLRPYEACGTSGMKAAMNGAMNLSVRDGWWDELYDRRWGWEIPSAEATTDPQLRDRQEAEFLYEIIESQIVPLFYQRDSQGLPTGWLRMMRDSIGRLAPQITAGRMVRDYVQELYLPAADASADFDRDGLAADLAQWKHRVRDAWSGVEVVSVDLDDRVAALGDTLDFAVEVRLGSLSPGDVAVQVVTGEVDDHDVLHEVSVHVLSHANGGDGAYRYEGQVTPAVAGTLGYTVRVIPHHRGLVSGAEMGLAAVAEG